MAYLPNKKTLKLDFVSTKVWAWRHIKCTSQLFSFETVQKIYDLDLRLWLMLETRVRCTAFVARRSYRRGDKFLQWVWNYEFASLLDEIQQAGPSETAGKSVTPCFTLVSDYKRLDTMSYFIITNFHTELKTSGKCQPWHEFSKIYTIHNHRRRKGRSRSGTRPLLLKFDIFLLCLYQKRLFT